MASGIEIVGLALAILPLLMSAANYYREGLDSLQTLRTKTGDDRILEFYEEVAFEIFLLRNSIKQLVKDLPGFSPEYKRQLVRAVDPRSWSDEALSDALRVRLGDSNYQLFEGTLRRVLESLDALISDSQLFLSSSEMVDENIFCAKLTRFRNDVIAGNSLSTLRNRVQFTARQHKRSKYLNRITKYNERLQRLLEHTSQAEVVEFDLRNKSPSPMVRTFAHKLHEALSRCWKCGCQAPHKEELFEAKLCLIRDLSFKTSFEISFDMLFVTKSEGEVSSMPLSTWQESIIHTVPKGPVASKVKSNQVASICELVEVARGRDLCLQMLLEDHMLWQIKPQGRRLNAQRNVSLETLLHSPRRWRLKDKRVLAVTLANTVLQLSEGPWLNKKWNAAHISFFEAAQNSIDFGRPYLTTQFQQQTTDDAESELEFQSIHASPSLLSLGILLLEINQGRPIEISPLDLTDGMFKNANTELTAAMRFFEESVEDIYNDYRRAIRACLEPTFLRVDQAGGLDVEEVRQLVYEHIVAPLEAELYNGFGLRVSGL